MRNHFTFGGINSRSLGIYISGEGVYNAPAREYEPIVIPGRNGDLLGIEKRLSNIELTYPAFCYGNFADRIAGIRSALLGLEGYQRLTDTYNPDEYRLAYFPGGTEVDPTNVHDAGNFELMFVCKPQRFMTSGEQVVSIAGSGTTLTNPTPFVARPQIYAVGYGAIHVGDQAITVNNAYPSVTIDSEIMDCYSGLQNANDVVSFADNDFPILPAGSIGITFDNTFTSVAIKPNWWRV